jgi:diaminohydroxyphosphoribosylaminopyrimidine deaminase/5-amino-6-(5-phosphoribosylamino)uracil reductase
MSSADRKYMQRALKLAHRGLGSVEPNPMVGCVITKAGQIIGTGWHKKFGEPHAEIVALEDCKNLGATPQGATMYVTLEPCCHQGKTGPCTEAIIAAGVGRVVVATVDPSSHAGGKGIEKLREAGIDVEVGLCRTEARLLNAPFIKHAASGHCWTVLKWAQSIDGRVAWAASEDDQDHRWISNELSRKDVHALRRRVDAVLVGINTVLADDPLLTPRPARGKKPLRVVMDSSLRIPLGCRLLRTPKSGSVLIYTSLEAMEAEGKKAERIRAKGAELLGYPAGEHSNLHLLLEELSRRGVSRLLVEGGPTVLTSFLAEQLADEMCIYLSPRILGAHGGAETTSAMAQVEDLVELEHVDVAIFDGDVRLTALTKRAAEEVLS